MQYETIKLSCELGLPVVDQESKQADCFLICDMAMSLPKTYANVPVLYVDQLL